jgi:hypothetical protein
VQLRPACTTMTLSRPIVMPEWLRVQLFPDMRPSRQEIIHKSDKSVVMMPLKEVNHFVDDDIFETMVRLLDQFEI